MSERVEIVELSMENPKEASVNVIPGGGAGCLGLGVGCIGGGAGCIGAGAGCVGGGLVCGGTC